MRSTLFVGNLEFGTRESDLDRLFSKYGKIEKIELKSGYAFVYFEDSRDAEDAIYETNNKRFGYKQRKLTVEWSGHGKSRSDQIPNKTLYVSNIDPIHTKERDVLRKFEDYGKVLSRIKNDHAFVRFARQEDATEAFNSCAHNIKILDRNVFVSYAWEKENERYDYKPRKRSHSPRRPRSSPVYDSYKGPVSNVESRRRRSPSYDRYRSRSPIHRARA